MVWFESLISLFLIKTATYFARSQVKVINLLLKFMYIIKKYFCGVYLDVVLGQLICMYVLYMCLHTLISLINVEGVQKLPNH